MMPHSLGLLSAQPSDGLRNALASQSSKRPITADNKAIFAP
jgi:hypothetical protein